jgi:DNA-binding SARP family transcriptional activator
LETNSESIGLSLHPQTFFDVRLFQEHLGAAKTALSNEAKASHFRAAEDLCDGELLEEIYSDWCLIERERLARLRLYGLGQLAACYMEQEAYDEAIEVCQRILDLDSLREEVHRALMICYAETGRRGDGIRQFQQCANLLLDELGIFPLPETIDIYKSMISKAADEL